MAWSEHVWGADRERQLEGIALVGACCVLLVVLLAVVALRSVGVGQRTAPSLYLYVAVLLGCAIALTLRRRRYPAFALLLVAALEMGVGFVPLILRRTGVWTSIPNFAPTLQTLKQYSFHPLLGGVPTPSWRGPNSKGGSISHTATGLRSSGRSFDASRPHIAIFGGSTTYDIGVPDGETWVSVLGELLPQYALSNNGVPGYSTVEHVVQTAFYADRAGAMPICSVYYVGWNDIRNFGMVDLDNGYAKFHLPSQYGNLEIRYTPNTASPVLNLLGAYFMRRELPFPSVTGRRGKDINADDRLFQVAERHLEAIVALNRSRGANVVFLGQVLNRDRLSKDSQLSDWMPFVRGSDAWPLQQRFNVMVQGIAHRLEVGYFTPHAEEFGDADFLDSGHFSTAGARKFAERVAPAVLKSCTTERSSANRSST